MKAIGKMATCTILLLMACTFPKDPQHTFSNAKVEGLAIGVVQNPPFTLVRDSSFSGTEITLLEQFCKKENLDPHFETGNETDLIKKLSKYELDIVVGGFKKKTVWKKEVGMTQPYDSAHVFFVPKGENRLVYTLERFFIQNKQHGAK